MEFRLELIHGAQVLNSSGQAGPLRSYKGILAALGYADKPLTRAEIIGLVWPEVPLTVGRNRLRVALVKIRTLLPGAITETPAGLALDPAVISTDVGDVRFALERSQDSVTIVGEFEALASALRPLGTGVSFDWEIPGASDFAEFVARSFVRLSELATELGHLDQAAEASKAATHFDPESPEAWGRFLVSHWRQGRAELALEDVRDRAPRRIQADEKFRNTVKEIRSKHPEGRKQISGDRRELWLEILDSLAESRPDLMRAILSSPQTLPLSGRHPRTMHDLLEQATPLTIGEPDLVWERSAARMIGLKAWLGDARGVLTAAPAVLAVSEDAQIRRAVWNAVAVAHSLGRDWKKAYEALDRTMEFARECGSEMYELTTRGNGAFFKMQEARFEESRADYDSGIHRLTEIDTPQARFEYAIAVGNRALIAVFEGNWEVALHDLEAAMAARTKGGLLVQMGILHACVALTRANLSRPENVVRSMRLAFLDAFETDSYRSQQFTFEVAAATISVLGDAPFARSLARWVEAWRHETHAPRSEAERLLVNKIPRVAKAPALVGEPPNVGMETMKRLRAAAQRASLGDGA